jgi:hypothetical protein
MRVMCKVGNRLLVEWLVWRRQGQWREREREERKNRRGRKKEMEQKRAKQIKNINRMEKD